ncbi:glycoside hydrolase family 3 protein [Aerococcus agrisoli]|uniref:beta-glucosidase n=1 Tax=Aerococcus agrisoli TaxID=2487350 RepID=A0A3N4GSC9_9LACT|nr:glycoside hydrolase family 3 N-terminal domain-containing protein [Aerococcus agrisoli]RPA55964.1 glycoside hydrolase family 3 protein [Aerococcus agrisoli]
MEPKQVVARKKEIIVVDGLSFKDLNGDGQLNPYEDWRLPVEDRIKDLLARMNHREKAGMFILTDKPMGISVEEGEPTSHDGIISEVEKDHEYPTPKHEFPTSTLIHDFQLRHLIVRENATPEEMVTYTNTIQEMAEESRLGIPMVIISNSRNENEDATFNADQSVRQFTTFPGTLGLAAMDDLDLIKQFAAIGHEEFLANNIRKGYMYMVDTATDPRWFRTFGTFGEDPATISAIAEVIIPVYQGDVLDEDAIALTIKHFPGGGARENGFDPHYAEGKFNVYPTAGSLEKYHLPPFKAAIQHNPASIMPYYAIPSEEKSATPQAPFDRGFDENVAFAYNKQFIQELLRDELGFKGYVNSDTGVLGSMAWGVENLCLTERAVKIIEAGTNVVSGTTDVDAFQEAMEKGLVSMERVDGLVAQLLAEMFALGLFENPYKDAAHATAVTNTPEKQAIAYTAHQKSVVLLKNEDNVLPLTKNKLAGKKVYVELFTKLYDEKEMVGRRRVGNNTNTDEINANLPNLIQAAFPHIDLVADYHDADIAILFAEPISGSYFEATPTYLDLQIHKETNVDIEKIAAIRQAVDQTIINVNLDLPFILENLEPLADGLTASFDTFIQAILDVILGEVNPSGKLPLTLPKNDAAVAVDENGICASPNDVPGYDKEKYMDIPYTYEDSQGNKYGLGFGLQYENA